VEIEWTTETSDAPKLNRRRVQSLADLNEILAHIEKEVRGGYRVIVELFAENGTSLGIGVGAPQSTLQVNMSSPNPPYYESRGDGSAPPPSEQIFYFQGHPLETPAEALISPKAAREAARIFFETGRRPDNVSWREL
jgi:hypothetical protein